MIDVPTVDLGSQAGMQALNRRLARLGVEEVDLTICDHGCGAEAFAQDGRVRRKLTVHGRPSQVAALDALADLIEAHRRTHGRRRR